jgi:L-ascorbate metabolism protein UlaG (beta-lactamase superfamily)
MMIFLVVVAVIVLITILFFKLPAFGRKPTGQRLQRIQQSSNYKDGAFQNQSLTPALTGGASYGKVMKDFFFGKHDRKIPASPMPVIKRDLKQASVASEPQITWFGHSSYLLQMEGKNILVDPVFSERTSPVQFAGSKAFEGTDVYGIEDMPQIDILLITHNHYDHLDYLTVSKLKDSVGVIITSLGVGADLERWGVSSHKIKELNWWEAVELSQGITFTAAPGRHFSGRNFKRNETLWSSFILEIAGMRLFLGGDSGYDTHFTEIGKRFGSFDLAILECGQYNAFWANIHMMPEETAQAAIDLHAKTLLPVHWGKFSLATHPWDDSIKRVVKAAAALHQQIITPMIGQQVQLNHLPASEAWWERVV